jgi:hypothetical protein
MVVVMLDTYLHVALRGRKDRTAPKIDEGKGYCNNTIIPLIL